MDNEPPSRTPSVPDEADGIDHDAQGTRLEPETATHTAPFGWREAFRLAWERVRKQQKTYSSRRDLGQDRTKSLVLLVAVAAILLLVFFTLFSRPSRPRQAARESSRRLAGRGRSATPREAQDTESTVTPMLNAETTASDRVLEGQVTPEDINRTSRTKQIPKPSPDDQVGERRDYALSGVDFSDSLVQKNSSVPSSQVSQQVPVRIAEERNLEKPSLIFVRSARISSSLVPAFEINSEILDLPPGTRLLARLEAPITSVVPTPVVAVIEYNYERHGRIAIPAGAKVLGRVAQVSSSGDVSIRFTRLEMPDGTAEKLDASAMSLNFRPLRGYVWGRKTGAKFLVRSLTGLGTVASYLVGPQASSSAGLISTNVLMRERLADNVATAGQEELNGLAFNQNLVVTVPGNTRLYVVLEKRTSATGAETTPAEETVDKDGRVNRTLPTLEELRQLMELRREINELYSRDNGLAGAEVHEQQ